MNFVPLIFAIILAIITIFTHRALLAAISIAVLVGIPAFQPTGLRSAIYVQEIVIAVAFFIWLLRLKGENVWSVDSSMSAHLVIIIFYMVIMTAVGYLRLGQSFEALIRPPLAGLRFGAVALAFIIPASIPLSEKNFVSILRFFYFALICFLLLTFLDSLGIVQLRERSSELKRFGVQAGLGGFNRTSTGNFAQYGLFIAILLMWIKRLSVVLGVLGILGFIGLLLLSLSRTNLVAVGIFGLLLILTSKGNRLKSLVILLIAVFGVMVIAINIPFVRDRLATIASLSEVRNALEFGGRIPGWKAAVVYLTSDIFTSIFGTGYDNWALFLASFTGLAAGHNVYLHVWGELGLVGGIIYLAFFFRITIRFARATRGEGNTCKIGRLSLCLMVSLLVANLTADVFYPTQSMITAMHALMFLFGLIVGRLRHPSSWVMPEIAEYPEEYVASSELLLSRTYN